jgi:hypothetical protein
MIAAHAVALDVTPATTDEADLRRYPRRCVENWLTLH